MGLNLKKGNKIYIKPSKRGSFTSYCGGKVTNECIQKGKNSPNAAIRKKATFAANARKWKHEQGGEIEYVDGLRRIIKTKKSGGKAFVKGVNVLDSNPGAYKHVKKRYKMAQDGTKLTFGQKIKNVANNVGSWINNNQGLVNTALSGITGIISANKKQKEAEQFAEAKEAEMKSFKAKTWAEKYKESLQSQNDRSDIVNMSRAYNQASNDAAQATQEKQQQIDAEVAAAEQEAAAAQGEAWGGLLKGVGDIAINALSKNGVPSSKVQTEGLTGGNGLMSNSRYGSRNNTSLLTGQKTYGSFNKDGSMNMGFGNTWNPMTGQKTSSIGGNLMSTPQLTPPKTNYSFNK